VTRGQEATASRKTQGSGITIVLDKDFIDKFADRATIKTDFRVDAVSKVHPASKDGEVHIGGVAVEAKLAAVAELTNPDPTMVNKFRDLAKKSSVAARTVEIEGAWRIWCEHAGTSNQSQFVSLPAKFKDSNPD